MRHLILSVAVLLLATAEPALAGNKLIPAGQATVVAKSTLTVTPDHEWNKLGARPGRNSEEWTLDGDGLNDLIFYGGIESGRTLFREVSKKNKPLPRFSSTMLLTDIPALLEQSYRIVLDTPLMTIGTVEPATMAGTKAVHFSYRFTRQNEDLERTGEATAAIIGGKLYLISFEAPVIFYFDRDAASARSVVASAKLG